MKFSKEDFRVEKITVGDEIIEVRAFRNRIYVDKPVNKDYQQMNIFVPEEYYRGENINGYSLHTAPIFMPNMVGGYMPGNLAEPAGVKRDRSYEPNTIFRALQHGYVVAVPAIRGRVQQNEKGEYTGKAPACIVDYKAAVRYLRMFAEEVPGDVERIITNGTSAGGALSSLMGATGNHPDYEVYLEEIGAAKTRDDIFAASCYCPITNLDHADMAYEWEFVGVNDFYRRRKVTDEQGNVLFVPYESVMTELQIKVSEELAKKFPAYLNSLKLKDENGKALMLQEDGSGTFLEYMKQVVAMSAQGALFEGVDLSDKKWIEIKDEKVISVDWKEYVKDITRMKTAPAFDGLQMETAENDLFGNAQTNLCHFTEYGLENSQVAGTMTDEKAVKLLNPMYYIEDEKAVTAAHWRIRHGECDRDTSLAISAILTLKLRENGATVDYHAPWNVPHSGDYDLEELFAWIDGMCFLTLDNEQKSLK